MSRIALSLLALIVAGGCSETDVTAPGSHENRSGVQASADQSSRGAPDLEVTFEKWFTAFPVMTGNTSYGPGTFAGRILDRKAYDNGVIIKLEAEYVVTDPTGRNSFTARIEGTENLETLTAVMNGVVTDGEMIGARVHVTFQVIAPCDIPLVKGTCFRGTIRVQPNG
jgi:hypothetical protein